MSFLGNLIWIVFGGLISSILWFIAGLILCITIVFIPFGRQCFKISNFVLWPFGSDVNIGNFGIFGLAGNIIWIMLFGWELCILHLIVGLIFCITVVGIPFGLQHFKFAKLALVPFGAKINR
ncbi:YccF domain-containing protein [Vallitalea guaymasensis]|uniref:YccF domain-containing protein n=1 Tax=Vallitalea guaymasensis TaxID=1185412 RepID=UPI000DE1C8A3|nr:YccF domain-containing protein [Vallitalea guaymasensis]